MNAVEQAVNAVRNGNVVRCTKEDYPDVRSALLRYAADRIDKGQDFYASIALSEVKRLNSLHDYSPLFAGEEGTNG